MDKSNFMRNVHLTCKTQFLCSIIHFSTYRWRFNRTPYRPELSKRIPNTLLNVMIQHSPVQFKPVYYRRHVDDTFAVFFKAAQPAKLLNYLNRKHTNITVTMECQQDNKLPFLEDNITIADNTINTSVQHTFSGSGITFLSIHRIISS